MYKHSIHGQKQQGMTLLEMLAAISITTIIVAALVASVLYFYRTNTSLFQQSLAVYSARKGVEQLVRDIREATYGDDGSFPIISMANNSMSFYSDIDRDSATERIRYYLQDTNLYKGVTNPTGYPPVYNDANEVVTIAADYIRNEEETVNIFTYYNNAGGVITNFADVSSVAFVTVNLIVNVNPERLPDEFTLRSSATIRNLKINL